MPAATSPGISSRRTASKGSASSIVITSAVSTSGAYDRRVAPPLTVVGSINLDLVAKVERLPRAGETLTGATLDRIPGGKGANQAVAAARLDAAVRMVGCVGRDPNAAEALRGLHSSGVDLAVREVDDATGIAIILVAADG